MKRATYFSFALGLIFTLSSNLTYAQTTFSLEEVASGLNSPVDIACSYNSLLFVVEQNGDIQIIGNDGRPLDTPFLSLSVRGGGEEGLLGMVFDPDYENNGYFYVNYMPTGGTRRTVVSRFSVSAQSELIADPNSELEIISITQPYSNHNAGDLNFGPDGYLYIAMGDGGAGGDPQNYSQNTASLLGKVLRLDVSNASAAAPYAIPSDNPFVGANPLDEIWSVGWRNPWRFSFDKLTGDMWLGDVGQGAREEVSFETASDPGGKNYGWRCYEGNNPFNLQGCSTISSYTFPVFDYNTGGGNCSVVGGYVYRGSEFSNLFGKYILADYCSGRFWALTPNGQGGFTSELLLDNNMRPSAFGQGENGDLFVTNLSNGTINKIIGEVQLPVEMVNFIARNSDEGVLLSWETKSEINNSHFIVERAIDDANFKSIGTVTGSGNSSESSFYTFSDTRSTNNKRLYYRLKQVDFDGRSTYSPSVSLDPSEIAMGTFEIYPNPVFDKAFIRTQGPNAEEFEVTIFDLQGAVVSKTRISGQASTLQIDGLSSLSRGSYFIQINGSGFSSLTRFVKG